MKCLDNCSSCIKDNGKDICKIAADDGIVKRIEPDDEVPDICRKKANQREKISSGRRVILRPKRWTVDVFPQLKKTFSVNLQIILYTFAYKNKGVRK